MLDEELFLFIKPERASLLFVLGEFPELVAGNELDLVGGGLLDLVDLVDLVATLGVPLPVLVIPLP